MASSSLSHASFVAKVALVAGLVLVLGVLASSAEKRVIHLQTFAANDTTCSGTQINPVALEYVTLEPGICTRFAISAGLRASSDLKRLDIFQQAVSTTSSQTESTPSLCEGEPTIVLAKGVCVSDNRTQSCFKYDVLPSSGTNSLGDGLCEISTENYSLANCTASWNLTQAYTLRHDECSAFFQSGTYFKVDCHKRVWGTYTNSTCLEADLVGQGGDGQCINHIYGASSENSAVVEFVQVDGAGAKLASWLSLFLSSFLLAW
jgi:hypothetical protein